MPQQVYQGATLQCSFGAAPATLTVVPSGAVTIATDGIALATIMDHKPMVNIPTFGMCSAPTNPAVIAATAAKLGVFTPAPCVPATTTPWTPGSPTISITGKPALGNTCTLMCQWLGVISITNPGGAKVTIP
ncbi:MAG: DUF4280 domain-containing protein [Caldilineaceae bacterium]